MTFTSIPPSLRPVVEDVARAIDARRNNKVNRANIQAEAAILAFLNACVERGVARKGDAWEKRNTGQWGADEKFTTIPPEIMNRFFPALILNLGDTNVTA